MTPIALAGTSKERGSRVSGSWLALCVILAALGRSYAIDRPWAPGDHDGFGGAFYSNVARNHLRYGYLETRFAPVVTTGELPRDRWQYYLTHPPFTGILVSLSFRVFGEHEWSARLVSLLFSVGSVGLIYLLGLKLWGPTVGWVAGLFAAFVPMGLIYGTHVEDQGPAVTFFALALFEAYRRGSRWLLWSAFVLGAGFDWPVHSMAAVLTLHSIATGRFRRSPARLLPFLSLLWIGGFVLYAQAIAPEQEQNYIGVKLLDGFMLWTGYDVDPDHFRGYTLTKPSAAAWFSRVGGYFDELFTLPLVLLAVVGLGVSLSRRSAGPLWILFSWGALYIAVFALAGYVHDYVFDLLTPFLALAAAVGAVAMLQKVSLASPARRALNVAVGFALLGLVCYWVSIGVRRVDSSRQQQASLGVRLNQMSKPSEGILSLQGLDVRDGYYADRPLRLFVNRLSLFDEAMADAVVRYRYFVVPRALVLERPDKPLFRRLEAQYPRTCFEGFYIYDVGTALGASRGNCVETDR